MSSSEIVPEELVLKDVCQGRGQNNVGETVFVFGAGRFFFPSEEVPFAGFGAGRDER